MSDIVIKAEGLGKKYVIGHLAQRVGRSRYTALRDVLVQNGLNAWHKTRDLLQGKPIIPGDSLEEVWALKDVDFEIHRGEAVGIIGRNGAGKSTLLKILSRITEPSAGRVTIRGRVASLLEVGTGFHPELTGRENVFLNGAILGMTQREIKRKFDEIVAFAEVEKFLDTPVKRYSSGMYVRLAFAVAAHLEPEILVVDEVLAVGDAAFQKKCLGKMGDVASEGRTVLFVSHNMSAIVSLCQRCVVLKHGEVQMISDNVLSAIDRYIEATSGGGVLRENAVNLETEYFHLIGFNLRRHCDENVMIGFTKSDKIMVEATLDIHRVEQLLNLGYALYERGSGQCLWWSFTLDAEELRIGLGRQNLRTVIPAGLLNDGSYRIEFLAALHNVRWILAPGQHEAFIDFTVAGGQVGTVHVATTTRPGLLFPVFPWAVTMSPDDEVQRHHWSR